jgi:hypothetical protein
MQFRQAGGESDDSKNYVKLKDGESVVGIFAGDIYEFSKHWVVNRSVVCTGEGCEHCKSSGKRGGFRFRVNFVVKNPLGAYEPKIFEQGWKVYKNLRELNEEYPLEDTIVKITRQGSQMNDTSYSVLPIKDCLVKPDLAVKIKALKLIDLRHSEEKHQEPPHPVEMTESDIPF